MPIRQIRQHESTAYVSLPKGEITEFLDDEGTIQDEQQAAVDSLGQGAFLVRLTTDGDVTDLEECDEIQRLIGQVMFQQAQGSSHYPTAD